MPNSGVSNQELQIELSYKNVENLKSFATLLNKDVNAILNEALSQYFESEQKKIVEKSQEDESMMTNLDFDEFWDGVDV